MDVQFEYILNKIQNAPFNNNPFKHIEIKEFLSKEHLDIILNDDQIHFGKFDNNDNLYNHLISNNWEIQHFPGCISNWQDYKNFLNKKYSSTDPVEGVGITFRLKSYRNEFIESLIKFMNSDRFHKTLREKFDLQNETQIISAIQKNLSNYEISPHPDIRQKALTYLLNINQHKDFENNECHTKLCKLKDNYKHVEEFWKNNPTINRCWVPWEWCDVVKKISTNNTLIIFKPTSSPASLHAIKLKYDHLKEQRTQIYGNLMFKNPGNYHIKNYKQFI
jgi:hypothetical protein